MINDTSNAYELRKEDYGENGWFAPKVPVAVQGPNIGPMIFEYGPGILASNITVYKHV
jgi:hypothetical protein